eukprot:764320-Hanusia_phi.AAC.3
MALCFPDAYRLLKFERILSNEGIDHVVSPTYFNGMCHILQGSMEYFPRNVFVARVICGRLPYDRRPIRHLCDVLVGLIHFVLVEISRHGFDSFSAHIGGVSEVIFMERVRLQSFCDFSSFQKWIVEIESKIIKYDPMHRMKSIEAHLNDRVALCEAEEKRQEAEEKQREAEEKLREAEEKLREVEEEIQRRCVDCILCKTKAARKFAIPCGHALSCEDCEYDIVRHSTCPHCRGSIRDALSSSSVSHQTLLYYFSRCSSLSSDVRVIGRRGPKLLM